MCGWMGCLSGSRFGGAEAGGVVVSGALCGGAGPWPPLPPEPVRSAGEDAEWDRNRVEEDPVLWELAMTDKAHREELAKSPPYDVLERKLAEEVGELP